ncbi:MAG: hypothetical protein KBT11_07650 [Treponema sp.]|nr:hypothetical protein [Candidatus Treponema equifaecale]
MSDNTENQAEAVPVHETAPAKKNKSTKKKTNPVLSFFKFIFTLLILLLLLVLAGAVFCIIDKKSSLAAVPRNYTAYIHTDSAFHTVNPLLDLHAADVLLSKPEYVHLRKAFVSLRSSPLRENKIVEFVLSRSVDLALYNGVKNQDFVAVLNLGVFSAVTRLSEFAAQKVSIPGLMLMTAEQMNYFQYETNGLRIYLKPVKNLLIASNSLDLLITASLAENDSLYTNDQKKLFSESSGKSLRIVANGRQLAEDFTGTDELLHSMAGLISPDSLSVIDLNISDSDISLKCQIPIEDEENYSNSLTPLLKKRSRTPSILSRLNEKVQYYTILNAGTLNELKDAVFPIVPREKNAEKTWKSAESLCKTALGMDLEDLIFSWTGSEFAAFGLENHNDPIFAVQVSDEKQRKKIFELITDSFFVKEDDSLILGGVRLPKLLLPNYLNWILSMFDLNMPSPYFLVEDGFIYFSQSPETLSQIYSDRNAGNPLVKSPNWQQVSSGQKSDASVSLFYDLEKSAPFFLRSSQAVSSVLRLYTMGRFDVRTKNSKLEFQLQACARKSGSLITVPGFPVQLGKDVEIEDFQFVKDENLLCWVENKHVVKTMDLSDMQIRETAMNDNVHLAAAVNSAGGGAIWTVSPFGVVTLLNPKLETVANFPVMLGSHISTRATATETGLYVPLEDEKIAFVSLKGSVDYIEIPELSVKSPVSVLGNYATVYDKGFLGKIYNIEKTQCLNKTNPIEVDEIGLGSPVLVKNGSKVSTAFISQSGKVEVWSNGKELKYFPVQLEGVYLLNLQASEKYLYALSDSAVLTRISLNDGKKLSVRIPKSTARNAYLSVQKKSSGKYEIYVNADSNVIYGFNENLELLSGFPLTGCGIPVFADINGNKSEECIALTLDKKIVAWKVR